MYNNALKHLFSIQVSWPNGRYSLPKPIDGCPLGWEEGCRYQDNEDNNNINSVYPNRGYHFFGKHTAFVIEWFDKHIIVTNIKTTFEAYVKQMTTLYKLHAFTAFFWSNLPTQLHHRFQNKFRLQHFYIIAMRNVHRYLKELLHTFYILLQIIKTSSYHMIIMRYLLSVL